MLQIEQLYGVEVIVHFPAPKEIKTPNGLVLPHKVPDWVEGTIIMIGNDCKKNLIKGDKVIVAKTYYQESPILPKNQFDFPPMENGEFRIMTEHLIAMKLSAQNAFAGMSAPASTPRTMLNDIQSSRD